MRRHDLTENFSKIVRNVSNVLFQPMAGHKFQAMDCLMFQNQKVTESVTELVTRSPIELFWTAKKNISLPKLKDDFKSRPGLIWGESGWFGKRFGLTVCVWDDLELFTGRVVIWRIPMFDDARAAPNCLTSCWLTRSCFA